MRFEGNAVLGIKTLHIFGLLLILSCHSILSRADELSGTSFRETFSLRTMGRDFISPVTTDARYSLLIGSAITGLAMSSKELDGRANEEFYEDRPLGSYAKVGDVLGQLVPNIAYAAWMLADDAVIESPSASRCAHHMIRATLHSAILSTILKASVREARPDNANSHTSFPSGHSATTFAFAAVVASEHEWYWGLAAYGLATFVGASRVSDGHHRWDDVLAGATIGVSYGLGVYHNMSSSSASSNARASGQWNNFAVVPTDGLRGAALAWRLEY